MFVYIKGVMAHLTDKVASLHKYWETCVIPLHYTITLAALRCKMRRIIGDWEYEATAAYFPHYEITIKSQLMYKAHFL